MASRKKEEKTKSKNTKKKMSPLKRTLAVSFIVLAGIVFLPTSTMLFIGMLPTITAFLVSFNKGMAKTSCIAAMNFAGCIPFILKLWQQGNTF